MPARDDVERARREYYARAERVCKKIMIDLFGDIIYSTPVDTGALRGAWSIGINANPDNTGVSDKDGAITEANVNTDVLRFQLGDVVFFANTMEYALEIENGHSKRHPQGMVKVNVDRWREYLQKAVAEERR